jgi:prepilin-type N-terminal cleavage/methylation domain-containing protein
MKRALDATRQRGRAAFTLIEMLIVIVILGILAMVIIPQISTSTDDAKLNTLRTNLSAMRNSVELYYAQHNSVYPGAVLGGAASASEAFVQQLTRYTDAAGIIATVKSGTNSLGPYIKGGALAKNPFNNKSDVTLDTTEGDITVKASSGTTGWKFYSKTGVLIADDGAHDNE